jgi:hypothetical protein
MAKLAIDTVIDAIQTGLAEADYLHGLTVTTTAREKFTGHEAREMANLVFKRFGRNWEAATAAWRRMMENGCDVESFKKLCGKQ